MFRREILPPKETGIKKTRPNKDVLKTTNKELGRLEQGLKHGDINPKPKE